MSAAKVKMRLTRPTMGKKAGENISVDEETAERLVASGSASRVKPDAKPDKG